MADAVSRGKSFLHLEYAFTDADARRCSFLGVAQAMLEVCRGGEVVGVRVRLENKHDVVPVLFNDGEQAVGVFGADGGRCRVVVQDGVDDDGLQRGWVGNNVLPGPRGCIVNVVNDDILGHLYVVCGGYVHLPCRPNGTGYSLLYIRTHSYTVCERST